MATEQHYNYNQGYCVTKLTQKKRTESSPSKLAVANHAWRAIWVAVIEEQLSVGMGLKGSLMTAN